MKKIRTGFCSNQRGCLSLTDEEHCCNDGERDKTRCEHVERVLRRIEGVKRRRKMRECFVGYSPHISGSFIPLRPPFLVATIRADLLQAIENSILPFGRTDTLTCEGYPATSMATRPLHYEWKWISCIVERFL